VSICISDAVSVERGFANHPLHSLYQMSCTPGMNQHMFREKMILKPLHCYCHDSYEVA